MIIELFLEVLYKIFSTLTSAINIPQLPTEIDTYFDTAFTYMSTGVLILNNYLPMRYLLTLFGIILGVDVGIKIYHFVMWIIRKIPMASIS